MTILFCVLTPLICALAAMVAIYTRARYSLFWLCFLALISSVLACTGPVVAYIYSNH